MTFRYRGHRITLQRLLIKLSTLGLLPGLWGRFLQTRTWTVEDGEGAGLKLTLPQNLDFIFGSSEPPVQRCLARYLAPGGVFYDVGANVGFFSLLAAQRVGRGGSVYSFEPVSENVMAIRRNARLNEMAHVSIFEVAADSQSGTGELLLADWDGGSSLRNAAAGAVEPVERRMVPVVSLDDLVDDEGLRPPTVVKIDVEGSEMGALQGMVKTLEKFKPVLVYEVDDADRAAFERRWNALDRFVARLGYDVTHLENSYPHLSRNVGHSVAIPVASTGSPRKSDHS